MGDIAGSRKKCNSALNFTGKMGFLIKLGLVCQTWLCPLLPLMFYNECSLATTQERCRNICTSCYMVMYFSLGAIYNMNL